MINSTGKPERYQLHALDWYLVPLAYSLGLMGLHAQASLNSILHPYSVGFCGIVGRAWFHWS